MNVSKFPSRKVDFKRRMSKILTRQDINSCQEEYEAEEGVENIIRMNLSKSFNDVTRGAGVGKILTVLTNEKFLVS